MDDNLGARLLAAEIGALLDQHIRPLLPALGDYKLTLLARVEGNPEADVIVTRDHLAEVASVIWRRATTAMPPPACGKPALRADVVAALVAAAGQDGADITGLATATMPADGADPLWPERRCLRQALIYNALRDLEGHGLIERIGRVRPSGRTAWRTTTAAVAEAEG